VVITQSLHAILDLDKFSVSFGFYHALSCLFPVSLLRCLSYTISLPPPFHALSHLPICYQKIYVFAMVTFIDWALLRHSSLPSLSRYFHSKTGRTRHIQALHPGVPDVDGLEPQDGNTSPSLPSVESSGSRHSRRSRNDEHHHPHPTACHLPYPHLITISTWISTLLTLIGIMHHPVLMMTRTRTRSKLFTTWDRRQQAPDPPHVTRTYHPTINGT